MYKVTKDSLRVVKQAVHSIMNIIHPRTSDFLLEFLGIQQVQIVNIIKHPVFTYRYDDV